MPELKLKIGGYSFTSFSKFKLGLNYNGIASVFSFEGFFDINNPEHKKLFKPLTYPSCEVLFDGKKVITGTILNYSSAVANSTSLTGISGYSKTGVLEDCEIPLEVYPLQSDGMSLKEITEKLIKPFGLELVIDKRVEGEVNNLYPDSAVDNSGESSTTGDEEKPIAQTNAKENQKVKDYICDLAKQRHIIVTHNSHGNLVFTRLNIDKQSIATFTENKPSTTISLSVNAQGLHSKITMQGQAQVGTDTPTEDSAVNNLVKVYRPTVKKQTSGNNSNIPLTTKMERGNELRNIQLTIETNEWYWFDGRRNHMILPNDIITVISPSNYLSHKSNWFVESVELDGDETRSTAVIKAVLPEVYTGGEPKYIFS
jgi:prophage tail gpP-like protein